MRLGLSTHLQGQSTSTNLARTIASHLSLRQRPDIIMRPCAARHGGHAGDARLVPCTSPLLAHRTQRAARRSLSCRATTSVDVSDKKRRILELSGSKNGTDRIEDLARGGRRTPEQKQAVAAIANELRSLNQREPLELTGSRWRLVFTESMASSSGRVGPFVGRTEQEFPADRPGQYINWLFLGPVRVGLTADYVQPSSERIDVSFRSLEVAAGPFKWNKELVNKGTWEPLFQDEEMRILTANRRNLFVLQRI